MRYYSRYPVSHILLVVKLVKCEKPSFFVKTLNVVLFMNIKSLFVLKRRPIIVQVAQNVGVNDCSNEMAECSHIAPCSSKNFILDNFPECLALWYGIGIILETDLARHREYDDS